MQFKYFLFIEKLNLLTFVYKAYTVHFTQIYISSTLVSFEVCLGWRLLYV